MSRPFSTSLTDGTSSLSASNPALQAPSGSADRRRHWAELVAVGAAPLPTDLPPAELQAVLKDVARLRRQRLVNLVARAIATDLDRDRERDKRIGNYA